MPSDARSRGKDRAGPARAENQVVTIVQAMSIPFGNDVSVAPAATAAPRPRPGASQPTSHFEDALSGAESAAEAATPGSDAPASDAPARPTVPSSRTPHGSRAPGAAQAKAADRNRTQASTGDTSAPTGAEPTGEGLTTLAKNEGTQATTAEAAQSPEAAAPEAAPAATPAENGVVEAVRAEWFPYAFVVDLTPSAIEVEKPSTDTASVAPTEGNDSTQAASVLDAGASQAQPWTLVPGMPLVSAGQTAPDGLGPAGTPAAGIPGASSDTSAAPAQDVPEAAPPPDGGKPAIDAGAGALRGAANLAAASTRIQARVAARLAEATANQPAEQNMTPTAGTADAQGVSNAGTPAPGATEARPNTISARAAEVFRSLGMMRDTPAAGAGQAQAAAAASLPVPDGIVAAAAQAGASVFEESQGHDSPGAPSTGSRAAPAPAGSAGVAEAFVQSVSSFGLPAASEAQGAASTESPAPTRHTEGPQEAPITGQVVKGVTMAWRDGVGEAKIRLTPEHLGEVVVALKVERGLVVANVQAETSTARGWIETHQQDLRDALSAQGLELDRLVVTSDGQRQQSAQEEAAGRQKQPTPRRRAGETVQRFEVSV